MAVLLSPCSSLACAAFDESVVLEEKSLLTSLSTSSSSSQRPATPPPSSATSAASYTHPGLPHRRSCRIRTNGSLKSAVEPLVRFAASPLVHEFESETDVDEEEASLASMPPHERPNLRRRLEQLGHRLGETRGRVYIGASSCSGFLWKRAQRGPRKWRRRWFVLDAERQVLMYRSNSPRTFPVAASPGSGSPSSTAGEEAASKRVVPFREIVDAELLSWAAPLLPSDKQTSMAVLCLETTQRLFFLATDRTAILLWQHAVALVCGVRPPQCQDSPRR